MTQKTEPTKRLFAEGTDTVGSGKRNGRGVVVAGYTGWTKECAAWLEWLNDYMKDYLLVVPQLATDPNFNAAISIMRNFEPSNILKAKQFSNAAAVMEMQWTSKPKDHLQIDHTRDGYGGECFKRLGASAEILFLGTPFDRDGGENTIHRMPNCGNYDNSIVVWDVAWEISIDPKSGDGEICLIGEAIAPKYTPVQVSEWGLQLRNQALEEEGAGNKSLASALYNVSNCTPDRTKILGFDPFEINRDGLDDENGDPASLIPDLEAVIAYWSEYYWELPSGLMREYYQKLKEHLEAMRSAAT